MINKKSRSVVRQQKRRKLRKKYSGTPNRPRLAVFRSNNRIYAQVIDDTVGNALLSASTLSKDLSLDRTNNAEAARRLVN